MATAKLGRNDLCACGSGRKYKKCCLAREAAGGAAPPPPGTDAGTAQAGRRRLTAENLSVPQALQIAVEQHQAGRLRQAKEIYEQILVVAPDSIDALHLLGVVALESGEPARAIELITRALDLDPSQAAFFNNLGNAQTALKRNADAIASYRRALDLNPDLAEAHANLGNLLRDRGQAKDAIACYELALAADGAYVAALAGLGSVLCGQGRETEAIACYRRALGIAPAYGKAHYLLACALRNQGDLETAIASFRSAHATDPDDAEVAASLLHALLHACAWRDLEAMDRLVDGMNEDAIREGRKTGESPFMSVTRRAEPEINLAIARSWSLDITQRLAGVETGFAFTGTRRGKARITVGYLSGDFHDHPTAHLIRGLFAHHDRERFETIAYSHGRDYGCAYRERIAADCDRFVDIRGLDDPEAAQRIYRDEVDILVDLKGHTKGNRLEICALRPAPVQVTYLGFPGSSGADFIDYVITDRSVTPDTQSQFYSETFVYPPGCYQINDDTQALSERGYAKRDFGVPETGFVFASFNHSYKLEPVIFQVWMNILRRTPESLLWLLRSNALAEGNLKREAAARGIDPNRLLFADKLPKEEHLKRLQLVDLCLDTRVTNGHTTTSDALWAGTPVVTLQGGHFASRVSASLLEAVDLPELITHGLDDYEALAVTLARDREALCAIKKKLAHGRLAGTLFDTAGFVRHLETAYSAMWDNYLTGGQPRRIDVAGA